MLCYRLSVYSFQLLQTDFHGEKEKIGTRLRKGIRQSLFWLVSRLRERPRVLWGFHFARGRRGRRGVEIPFVRILQSLLRSHRRLSGDRNRFQAPLVELGTVSLTPPFLVLGHVAFGDVERRRGKRPFRFFRRRVEMVLKGSRRALFNGIVPRFALFDAPYFVSKGFFPHPLQAPYG